MPKRHVICIAFALAALSLQSNTSFAGDGEKLDAFKEHFNFCDARLIAEAWDIDPDEAKLAFGEKILDEGADAAFDRMDEARAEAIGAGAQCDASDAPYAYQDYEMLGEAWDMDVQHVKAEVGFLLTQGEQFIIDEALATCRAEAAEEAPEIAEGASDDPEPQDDPEPSTRSSRPLIACESTLDDGRKISVTIVDEKNASIEAYASDGHPTQKKDFSDLKHTWDGHKTGHYKGHRFTLKYESHFGCIRNVEVNSIFAGDFVAPETVTYSVCHGTSRHDDACFGKK